MIAFQNLSIRRGSKLLLEGVTLTIHVGNRVGLVGRNGSGKSSLLDALRGELTPDAGEIDIPKGLVLASLRQEIPTTAQAALEYVKDGDPELRRIEDALGPKADEADGNRIAALHAQLEAIDGYTANTRAARLLAGLGFAPEDNQRPVDEFSGGWRMRLNLAQALMCRSDVLLLDEPTNHLDLEAIVWLENWIRRYQGTAVLISHDRDFLDAVADRILHLEQRSLTLYRGNYSEFERTRAERLAQSQALAEKQSRERAHMQRFVDRFRAKATKARQAQSRLKALERMGVAAAAHIDPPFVFSFPVPERCPDPLLKLEDVAMGYGDDLVLAGVHLTLTPGLRLGLLGLNGAGKSTLVRTLAGEIEPSGGKRIEHNGLRIGYFAQHQMERLDLQASPLIHHRRQGPEATSQRLRNFLGGFGFGEDLVNTPVATFSGGERARLVLSLLVRAKPNVLLLDEPTNHLDMDMRYAIEVALQDFVGALVLVSHDRHLLRTTVDDLLLLHDGRAEPYRGDIDAYRAELLGQRPASKEAAASSGGAPCPPTEPPPESALADAGASRAERKAQRQTEAARRRQRQPAMARLGRLEKMIGKLSLEQAALDEQLSEPSLYAPERKAVLDGHLFERARKAQQLEELESEWLSLQESLEAD